MIVVAMALLKKQCSVTGRKGEQKLGGYPMGARFWNGSAANEGKAFTGSTSDRRPFNPVRGQRRSHRKSRGFDALVFPVTLICDAEICGSVHREAEEKKRTPNRYVEHTKNKINRKQREKLWNERKLLFFFLTVTAY